MTGQNTEAAVDLESTVELPVLDATSFEPTPQWIVARTRAGAEARRSGQRPAKAASNGFASNDPGQLERELAEARRARTAAEQRTEELARELVQALKAGATTRDELQSQLAVRDSHQAELEKQLQEAQQALQRERGETPANDEIAVRDQLIQRLEAEAREQSAASARRQSELERKLQGAEQLFRGMASSATRLETELARLRSKDEVQPAETETTATQARIEELTAALVEQQEAVRMLRAEAVASTSRARELETDLRLAEQAINRRDSKIAELEALRAQLRAEGEDARAAVAERDALIDKLRDNSGARSPAPFGAQRLLIRTDGDTEIAHVLNRRTSIGRSIDNDVHVEVRSISRHHALIVSSPSGSVIEDLRSTNGVRVNGRRITRCQPLKHGDSLIIGKAQFRFVMRDAPEDA